MQAELAKLDPKALEQLPSELRDALPTGGLTKGLPGLGGGGVPRLPGLGGGASRPWRAGSEISGSPGQEEVKR